MRRFKCAECGHEFEVAHGTGGMGRGMKCPVCGGTVHREDASGPPQCAGGRGLGRRANEKKKGDL